MSDEDARDAAPDRRDARPSRRSPRIRRRRTDSRDPRCARPPDGAAGTGRRHRRRGTSVSPRSGPDPERAIVAEDAQRFELAVEGRALHADKGGGARNIAAETGDLRQQVFALEDLARVAQWQGHDLAALVPFDDS